MSLDARSTALLILDLVDPPCAQRPSCVASLPAAVATLAKARAAGAVVVYTLGRAAGLRIRPELAPRPDDPVVASSANKFHGTGLDEILRARRARTLALLGMSANGAVMYTAFEACTRGYTVVVVEDAVSAEDPVAVMVARYQLLHQPGFRNLENAPLKPGGVTLTLSDLIELAPLR